MCEVCVSEENCLNLPSLWVNEPVAFPFPSTGWEEALLFQFHFSSHVGELMAANQASRSPLAKHMCLVLILQKDGECIKGP